MADSDLFFGIVAFRLAIALLVTLVVRELPPQLRDRPDDGPPAAIQLVADSGQPVAEPANDSAMRDMLSHD